MLINSSGFPDYQVWQERGQRYKERFLKGMNQMNQGMLQQGDEQEQVAEDPDDHKHDFNAATCRVQVCRSISDWSHGFLTEHSIQNACE
jgi:phospholipase D1/2